MIRPEDNIQFALEKIAEKEDKRTFPISRAATSPLTWGAAGASAGAGAGLLGREMLKAMNAVQTKLRDASPEVRNAVKVPGRLRAALPAAVVGASLLGGGAAAARSVQQRADRGRARKGAKGLGASDRAVMEALRARQAMSKKSSDNVHVAIEKLAAKKLRVGEIEDRLGFYLDDPQEQQVRDMLGAQVKKRFALRHPWLTGIPTLGIAPAVSAENAYSSVFRRLMRSQPDLRTRHKAWQVSERDRERQDYKDETKRLLATQQERAAAEHGRTVGALATAALAAQAVHNDMRNPDDRERESA